MDCPSARQGPTILCFEFKVILIPTPPPQPCLPLASIKTCLCMYVWAEGNTGRFFEGWGEISRGIWGRWIWMGSLLLESTTDREVNSSWPEEGRTGWGGWCMHWHTFGAQLYIPLSVIHSPSLRTISHYSFTLFCCYIVGLLLLDNLVDSENEVLLSIHRDCGCLHTWFQAWNFLDSSVLHF